jgi:uncharacterized membrane protein (DUF2068 family)
MLEISEVIAGQITPVGKNVGERKLSVVRHAGLNAALMLAAQGGKVGKAAAQQGALVGLDGMVRQCANADYRDLAAYIAAMTGTAACISSRASFESLPDRFEEAIQTAKSGKNGGYSPDGMKPVAKLALALVLKAFTVDMIAAVNAVHAARKAQREADLAEMAALLGVAAAA